MVNPVGREVGLSVVAGADQPADWLRLTGLPTKRMIKAPFVSRVFFAQGIDRLGVRQKDTCDTRTGLAAQVNRLAHR